MEREKEKKRKDENGDGDEGMKSLQTQEICMLDRDVRNAFFVHNRAKLSFFLLQNTSGKLGCNRCRDITTIIT